MFVCSALGCIPTKKQPRNKNNRKSQPTNTQRNNNKRTQPANQPNQPNPSKSHPEPSWSIGQTWPFPRWRGGCFPTMALTIRSGAWEGICQRWGCALTGWGHVFVSEKVAAVLCGMQDAAFQGKLGIFFRSVLCHAAVPPPPPCLFSGGRGWVPSRNGSAGTGREVGLC